MKKVKYYPQRSLRSNEKKLKQLGMHLGTASGKLKKSLMFSMVKELNRDVCFKCGKLIESENDFSIEHKVPYLDSEDPIRLFFDINNIAFSHLKCNIGSGRKRLSTHGKTSTYNRGCRCDSCTHSNKIKSRSRRLKIS